MTEKQIDEILTYMKVHPLFAANTAMGCNPAYTKQRLSQELTELVCKNGAPKTQAQVLDCWKYTKKQAKKYAQKVKWNEKTGNRTETEFKIKPKFEKILAIVGTKHGFGLEVIEEDGFSKDETRLVQDNDGNSKGNLKRKLVRTPNSTKSAPQSATVTSTSSSQINNKSSVHVASDNLTREGKRNRVAPSTFIKSDPSSTPVASCLQKTDGEISAELSPVELSIKGKGKRNLVSCIKSEAQSAPAASTSSSQTITDKLSPKVNSAEPCTKGTPMVKVNLTQPLSQLQNKVVGICDHEIKLETQHSKYMEAFKEYATTYKTKPRKIEARSVLALNTMNEGNSNIKTLNESVQELKQVEIERNHLLKQLIKKTAKKVWT